MALIGIFIFGIITGSGTTYLLKKNHIRDLIIQTTYLKNYISGLEEDARQAKRKAAHRASRRNAKKGRAVGAPKGTSKEKSGGSKSS